MESIHNRTIQLKAMKSDPEVFPESKEGVFLSIESHADGGDGLPARSSPSSMVKGKATSIVPIEGFSDPGSHPWKQGGAESYSGSG